VNIACHLETVVTMAFNETDLLARASDLALASAAPSIRAARCKGKSQPKAKTKTNKSPPRCAKLDGPSSRPRGRHAVARSDTSKEDNDDAREVVTIPVNQRLGFPRGLRDREPI
jgi:hypothetical protein